MARTKQTRRVPSKSPVCHVTTSSSSSSVQRKKVNKAMKAIKEIKRCQRDTCLYFAKLPFSRLVREVMADVGPKGTFGNKYPNRIQKSALRALQEASEIYLTLLFDDAVRVQVHARRQTLMVTDMRLVSYLKN